MAERTTKGHVEVAFVRAMRAIGGDFNPENVWSYSGDGPKYTPIAGRYALDNAAQYGGVCIVQCSGPQREGDGFGEKHVTRRMKYGEFVDHVRFLTDLKWSQEGNN